MKLTKKTKYILLGAAAAILLIAAAWSLLLSGGTGGRISRELRRLGYNVPPPELYAAATWEDESIRGLLGDEGIDDIVAASIDAGFRSDIDQKGDITLIMAEIGGGDTIMLFLLYDDIELAFLDREGQAVAITQ